MSVEQFYQTRQAEWKRLSQLLDRGQRNVHQLSPEEVESLGRLYRAATSDLALAQRDYPRHRVTAYLNQLVGRAHAVIYRDEPLAGNRLLRFVTHGFPRVYRQSWPFILAATLMFFLPALLAGLVTAWQPESAAWLLPPSAQPLISQIENQQLWTDIAIEERPYTSTFIMQNNIQVVFLAFGGGVLAGLLTIYVMINNGLLLGAISGLTFHYGIGFDLWTFVIGHGVIELSVICISGGAGLMLGWAIIQPGLLRRRDALSQAAQRAVRLIIGCVPLLLLAGAIEGFISPAETLPWPVKWLVGLGSGLIFYSYLLLAGRSGILRRFRYRRMRPFSSR